MSSFTRKDLAVELANKFSIPVDKARLLVDQTLEILAGVLLSGRKIEFRGFGIFDVVKRKPKIGRNPSKPQAAQYMIPARSQVRFHLGKELFYKLNPDQ